MGDGDQYEPDDEDSDDISSHSSQRYGTPIGNRASKVHSQP